MRILFAILSIVFAFGLSSCTGDSSDKSEPSATTTVTESATQGVDMDMIFLETLRDEMPELDAIEDSELISLGEAACSAFDSGATFSELIEAGSSSGFSAYDQGFIIGVSVGALCPEYTNRLG